MKHELEVEEKEDEALKEGIEKLINPNKKAEEAALANKFEQVYTHIKQALVWAKEDTAAELSKFRDAMNVEQKKSNDVLRQECEELRAYIAELHQELEESFSKICGQVSIIKSGVTKSILEQRVISDKSDQLQQVCEHIVSFLSLRFADGECNETTYYHDSTQFNTSRTHEEPEQLRFPNKRKSHILHKQAIDAAAQSNGRSRFVFGQKKDTMDNSFQGAAFRKKFSPGDELNSTFCSHFHS